MHPPIDPGLVIFGGTLWIVGIVAMIMAWLEKRHKR